jgi:methylthioribose-1-phosphate isomerase
MYVAHRGGVSFSALCDETRPLLQGARLTAWELSQAGIDTTLICDSASGAMMKNGRVHLVLVGADRIAANGDAANKIGTYNVAVLARHHGIPFYVAAPTTTIDFSLESGTKIPIEQRSETEVTTLGNQEVAERRQRACNPAFDVTPAELITGIITERGIVKPEQVSSLK